MVPLNVHVPVPFLVTAPVVVPMLDAIEPLPSPASVRLYVAPVIVPVLVRLNVAPLDAPMVALPLKVMRPPYCAVPVPAEAYNAPLPLHPVPAMVVAGEASNVTAPISNSAPLATVTDEVLLVPLPNAPELLNNTTPPVIFVAPV